MSLIQSSNNWMTFSACYVETHDYYGWSKQQVDWLTAWGPLLFIPSALCLPSLSKVFTVRALMTLANLFMCIGTIIRSVPPSKLPSDPNYPLILAHFGQILIAVSAPMVFTAPQQLSAVWFPKEERTLSTSMAVVSGYGGAIISYLSIYYVRSSPRRVLTVLRLEAVFSLVFFIVVLSDQIWYSDVPPIPPSVSSMLSIEKHTVSEQSLSLKQEMALILKNKKLHFFCVVCGGYQV